MAFLIRTHTPGLNQVMSEESSSFSQIVSDLRVFGDVIVVVASLPQPGQGGAQAVPALCHQLSVIKKLLRFNLYISLICVTSGHRGD